MNFKKDRMYYYSATKTLSFLCLLSLAAGFCQDMECSKALKRCALEGCIDPDVCPYVPSPKCSQDCLNILEHCEETCTHMPHFLY